MIRHALAALAPYVGMKEGVASRGRGYLKQHLSWALRIRGEQSLRTWRSVARSENEFGIHGVSQSLERSIRRYAISRSAQRSLRTQSFWRQGKSVDRCAKWRFE